MFASENDAANSSFDVSKVTFAGERGYELCREIAQVSAGLMPIESASPGLTRRPDGSLQLRVSAETLSVLTS